MGPQPIDSGMAAGAGGGAGGITSGAGAGGTSTGASQGAARGESSQAAEMMNVSASSTAVSARTQIDQVLSSAGSEASGEKSLRMILALLILEALLGKNEDESQSPAAGLLGGLAGLDQRSNVAVFSSTNIVQFQHQSTQVYTDQAVQTSSGAEQTGGSGTGAQPTGGQLDVLA